MSAPFASALLAWYDRAAAALPWRKTNDPYVIWLSEIMLQQTQVETVIPYFLRFLAQFPNIHALANAPLDDVLKSWEGLGYYSRARNLHKLSGIVAREFGGHFPTSAEELQKLPGIGRYTAGAVASIAFGQRVPVLDGNVMRVFARLTDFADDVTQTSAQAHLWGLAEAWLPERRVGDYNQALMELGRTVCKPRLPLCASCPLQTTCAAYKNGTQRQRPVKKKKGPTPHYDVAAGLIYDAAGRVLIAQRPTNGLLGGLWEFPGGKQEQGESLVECLKRELREELGISAAVGPLFVVVRHAFTHFKITLHVFICQHTGGAPQKHGVQDWAWVRVDELERYAFGKADRAVIAALRGK